MFNAKLSGQIDIARINRPIQLLAVFIIVIDIAFLIAGYFFSSNQTILTYICVFSAIFFTIIVLGIFIFALFKLPWALHLPTDFQPGEYFQLVQNNLMKHLEEYREESLIPKIENNKINSEKREESAPLKFQQPPYVSETTQDNINIQDENQKISEEVLNFFNYYENAIMFENEIKNLLNELRLSILIPSAKAINADFIVTNKNGQSIPIEVKYYRKTKPNRDMIKRLVDQMKKFMDFYRSDEAIIILSSGVDNATKNLIKSLAPSYTIHVIDGTSKEQMKNELKKILT